MPRCKCTSSGNAFRNVGRVSSARYGADSCNAVRLVSDWIHFMSLFTGLQSDRRFALSGRSGTANERCFRLECVASVQRKHVKGGFTLRSDGSRKIEYDTDRVWSDDR